MRMGHSITFFVSVWEFDRAGDESKYMAHASYHQQSCMRGEIGTKSQEHKKQKNPEIKVKRYFGFWGNIDKFKIRLQETPTQFLNNSFCFNLRIHLQLYLYKYFDCC